VVGPRVCHTQNLSYNELPASLDNEKWRQNFALKCMGVDYRRKKPQHALPECNSFDMQSFFTDYEHNLHVFVHHFAVPDFFGRGYTRATSLAYVSQTPKKIQRIVGGLKQHFTRISNDLKRDAQTIFLQKIDDAIKWLDWKSKKYQQDPVKIGSKSKSTPATPTTTTTTTEGLREILATNNKELGTEDYFQANKYEEYFQVSLDKKTLDHIKEDMLEIREQFSEPIRELQASEAGTRTFKLRDRDRQHHRPHAKRAEFVSLMELLSKESVERLKARLDKILSHFHRSSLDIMIERTARLPDKDPELLFNIGTLSVIPIGLNKAKQRRAFSRNSPRSVPAASSNAVASASSPLLDPPVTEDQRGEPTAPSQPRELPLHRDDPRAWQQDQFRQSLRPDDDEKENEGGRGSSKRGSLPSVDLSWATIPATKRCSTSPVVSEKTHDPGTRGPQDDEKTPRGSTPDGDSLPTRMLERAALTSPPILSSRGIDDPMPRTQDTKGSTLMPRSVTPVDTNSGDNQTSFGNSVQGRSQASDSNERKSHISDYSSQPASHRKVASPKSMYRTPEHDLEHVLSKVLLGKFKDFAEDLLYTILVNRPLVIVSPPKLKKRAQQYARALSNLIPGYAQHSGQVAAWRATPFSLDQLATIKIAAMSAESWKKTTDAKADWVSYIDLSTERFYGEKYRRKGHQSGRRFLHDVLKGRTFESPSQFRRHLCSKLLELQLAAYLYYWMAVVGVYKPPWSQERANDRLGGPFLRPLDSKQKRDYLARLAGLNLTHPMDRKIVQQWARIVEASTYEHYLQRKLPPSKPPKSDPPLETPKKPPAPTSVLACRERLLKKHAARPPSLLMTPQEGA